MLMLVFACGKQGETPAEKAAKAKATAAEATATEAPPTATPTEEPTATPAPSPTPLPTSPPEAQESDAEDLQLLGILRGGNSSGALIGFGGKQEIFRKGDAVFDHGTIKEVREDSVVIRSGSKDVTLKIVSETAPVPAEPPADQVIEAPPPPREAAPPSAAEPLARSEVRSGLRDLADVLAKADAQRVSVGGGHGLQLGTVEPASFLAKLGLRNGDVLQKINGSAVEDLDKVPDLSAAADGKELTITFSRNDIGLTVARRVQ